MLHSSATIARFRFSWCNVSPFLAKKNKNYCNLFCYPAASACALNRSLRTFLHSYELPGIYSSLSTWITRMFSHLACQNAICFHKSKLARGLPLFFFHPNVSKSCMLFTPSTYVFKQITKANELHVRALTLTRTLTRTRTLGIKLTTILLHNPIVIRLPSGR